MKGVYSKVYKMSRNEAVAVSVITFAVVISYSAWGAYLLNGQDKAVTPQVVTVER